MAAKKALQAKEKRELAIECVVYTLLIAVALSHLKIQPELQQKSAQRLRLSLGRVEINTVTETTSFHHFFFLQGARS